MQYNYTASPNVHTAQSRELELWRRQSFTDSGSAVTNFLTSLVSPMCRMLGSVRSDRGRLRKWCGHKTVKFHDRNYFGPVRCRTPSTLLVNAYLLIRHHQRISRNAPVYRLWKFASNSCFPLRTFSFHLLLRYLYSPCLTVHCVCDCPTT